MEENIKKGETNLHKKIPQHKKYWYSITKFELYPEMAAEGVGSAFKYLTWLIFIFGLILTIGILIKFNIIANKGIKYLSDNFSDFTYKNGTLSATLSNENVNLNNIIINTSDLSDEQIKKYENESAQNSFKIILLKNNVIIKANGASITYKYTEILDSLGVTEFDKATLLEFLNAEIHTPAKYIIYGLAVLIYLFIMYFISSLFDILILSLFGLITTVIAKIKMRYRALFNMSVFAITISKTLELIYMYITLFTNFKIKYFDIMYSSISFICLVAAIFMIKSDVIKQQLQLMQIIEMKKKQNENDDEKEEKEEEKEEQNKEKDDEEENKEKKDSKETGNIGGDTEGSNA